MFKLQGTKQNKEQQQQQKCNLKFMFLAHMWPWNKVSQLVSWCFEPSQPQRITSGLNTNFTLSLNYSFQKSPYRKSCLLSLFIFRGHTTREPASNRVTYFILRAYTGTSGSHSQHSKISGEVWKKCRWMDLKSRNSKEETPGSRRSMYGYILTYSRL